GEREIDLHFFHHAAQRVDAIRLQADADHDDLAMPPHHPDSGAQGRLDADTFEDNLRRAPGDLFDRFGRIALSRVDDRACAELHRNLGAAGREFRYDHRARAL